jgi:prophage maintenance system killer protein
MNKCGSAEEVSRRTLRRSCPHHERVPRLMKDVVAFAERTDVPVLIQAAIAHAQFETVHPFPDGNGRTGRALLQGMLRHSGLTRNVAVPVSAGLLYDINAYFRALAEYRAGWARGHRHRRSRGIVLSNPEQPPAGQRHPGRRETLGQPVSARSDSSVHRVNEYLLRQPVVNTKTVAADLHSSEVAAQGAIGKLVDPEILTQTGAGRRNRIWQAPEILGALDAFGRRARHGR